MTLALVMQVALNSLSNVVNEDVAAVQRHRRHKTVSISHFQ